MRGSFASALVVAALALAACGSSETPVDEKVHETVETFLEACAREQPVAALGVLTEPARKRFIAAPSPAEGCREILALDLAQPPSEQLLRRTFAEITIARVTVTADIATVALETPDGERSALEVESSGDLWYVTNPPERPREPGATS